MNCRRLILIVSCFACSFVCAWAKAGKTQIPDSLLRVEYQVGDASFVMHRVEGGTFMMGATSEQRSDRESTDRPAHVVCLHSYYIAETEVTNELWNAVMPDWKSSEWKYSRIPMNYIDFADCQKFISRLDSMTGLPFRLPTEAEWEFAARGGNQSQAFRFSGSNSIEEVAWTLSNSGFYPHMVAQKQPNELGLYDMTGNLNEWCSDYYAPYYMGTEPNPQGPDSGELRIVRGGSYDNCMENSHVSYRQYFNPETSSSFIGMRLALTLPNEPTLVQTEEPALVRNIKIGRYHYKFHLVPGDHPYYIAEQDVSNAFWRRLMKDKHEGRLLEAATGMSQSERTSFLDKCRSLSGVSLEIASEDEILAAMEANVIRKRDSLQHRQKRREKDNVSVQKHRRRVKKANVWLELLHVKIDEPDDPTLGLYTNNPADELPLRLIIRL